MITIKKSATADSRTCDFTTVSKDQLLESSQQHITDVIKGLAFFENMLYEAGGNHDEDKISAIDQFYDNFSTGFKKTDWWDNHVRFSRHHLLLDQGVPEDVTLIDVIEMIVDCVMAGMGRTGKVYPLDIKPEILMRAFQNTAELLKDQVTVED